MSKRFGCGGVAVPAPPKAGVFDAGIGLNVPFRLQTHRPQEF